MRILFLTHIRHDIKAGLFVSVINRTRAFIERYSKDSDIFSIVDTDGSSVIKLKKLLKKSCCNIEEKKIFFNRLNYTYIFNKRNIIDLFVGRYFKKTYNKKLISKLEREINIKNYDLIHAHWAYPIGYIAKLIKDMYGIPYVLTVHGSDIHTNPLKNKFIKKYTLEALECANKVVFVSNGLLNSAKQLGYSGYNSIVIPNGVDTDVFKELNKQEIKNELKFKNKVVGFVGNLIETKRADKLPTIFEYVIEKNENVEFLVIGDGELKDKIQKECIEKNINVRFIGKVSPEEVPYYINAMDTLILPSRNEAWGIVILEANACAIPVVGSDAGGIPEAIGDLGKVVKEGNSFEERFAEAIIGTLNENYNRDLLKKRALSFSWEKIAEAEYKIYKEVFYNS
ncbi:MAG: glycosyltransferase family 4 protein [Clostridium lundense]|nr:glycosyltransferase family 4 protein [Clostridium lundense]